MRSGKRAQYLLFAAVFATVLGVYLSTLCPTVYWEDAGELITVSHVLGIAHPPGHPLYTLLGHFFTLAPVGAIAQRVNFMSALFGALAAACVYPATLRLLGERGGDKTIRHFAGAAAALFAGFGLTLWDQSVVAETSTLHAFFFMLLLLTFVGMLNAPDERSLSRRMFLFAFLYGISLTNHVAGLFLVPAFALWAVVKLGGAALTPKRIGLSALLFALGLSVYVYLPLRSAQDPVIDWGNPEKLSNFWWVVTAGQFRDNVLSPPTALQMLEAAGRRILDIGENYMGVGSALILIGLWDAIRRRKDFLLFSAAAVGTLFLVTLNPAFIAAYFIPALLLLAIFLGFGANTLADAAVKAFPNVSVSRAVGGALCCVVVLLSAFPLLRHYPMNDRSDYYLARDYGMRILETLPPNAAFFTIDLNAIFTLWYLMYCEGMREDVLVIEPTWLTNSDSMREEILERYPDLLMPEAGEKIVSGERLGDTSIYNRDLLLAILQKNAKVRPVYWGAVPVAPSLTPAGLVYEFSDSALDAAAIGRNTEFWEDLAEQFRTDPVLAGDRVASLVYPENLRRQGQFFMTTGREDLALWALELATMMNPAHAPAWLQLGKFCKAKGEYERALECLAQAARLDSRLRPRARFHKGEIFYESGQYGLARAEFLEVARERHDFPNVHNMIGSMWLLTGDIRRAEDEFREEIKLSPETPGAYSNLAQILIQRGDLDEAEQLLVEGIRTNEQLWQNFYFLAVVTALKGQPEEAGRQLDEATRLGGPKIMEMARNHPPLATIVPSGPERGEN